MSPRIFITGVSGFIGGHFLNNLASTHPDYDIVGLVRTEDQAKIVAEKLPSVKIVIGDLDHTSLLIEESKKADVVIQAADADHNGAPKAIIKGLSLGGGKGAFIQLSGAANIVDSSNGFGQASAKVWDDIDDLHEISTFDHSMYHAITDQLVLKEGKEKGVRTAIVIPPGVWGQGKGPIKIVGMGLPWLVEAIAKRGKAFLIGAGEQHASNIHVNDLADVFIFLAEQALDPNGKANWGEEGMYYAEGGSYVFKDLVAVLAKEMHKREMIPTAEIEEISAKDASSIHPYANMIWGANMRVRASRFHALGWVAKQPAVVETLSEILP